MNSKSKQKRVAIVFPWATFDTVPSLCNAVELLAAAGFKVDIFTRIASGYLPPSFKSNLVEVIALKRRGERHGLLKYIPGRWLYPLQVLARHLSTPYCAFIGVDPEGLTEARALVGLLRIPLIYYSLELLLSYELAENERTLLKRQERVLSRQAKFIIIQDESRAKLLAADNDIPLERFVYVPNAPMQTARYAPSRYWHERFNLPSDCRVVLHAGAIDPWTGIEGIVQSVPSWSHPWVLVVHTRFHLPDHEWIESLKRIACPERVFFSLNPVPFDEYSELVHGADVGIAFYFPIPGNRYAQENIRTIGLSSGKIASYLCAGLPVIVNRSISVSHLLEQGQCGVGVEDADAIASALAQIGQSYQEYSRHALDFFNRHLNFEERFKAVIARL